MDIITKIGLEAVAREALGRQDWRTAAVMFTAAADAIPVDPVHRMVPARAQGLRRDAHLALCRTEEFKAYRDAERIRRKRTLHRDRDFRDEWEQPDGSLVHRLLAAHQRRARMAGMVEA